MKADFLFGTFPFVAVGLLVVGIVVRYLLLRKSETISAEVAQAKAIFAGGRLWQAALLLLVAVHVLTIIAPQLILSWNASQSRLYLLEAVAFLIGLAALAGWISLMLRNFKRHGGSALAEFSDTILLALLFVGILSGLLMAAMYRWSSSWGAMILGPYLVSFLRGKASANFVLQMPFLVRLHVFSFFAAVAVLPVTRLGTAIIFALQATFRWAGKPISATGRASAAWLRKHNPAPYFWPEED
jgi:nitrate reductase gamma subunit